MVFRTILICYFYHAAKHTHNKQQTGDKSMYLSHMPSTWKAISLDNARHTESFLLTYACHLPLNVIVPKLTQAVCTCGYMHHVRLPAVLFHYIYKRFTIQGNSITYFLLKGILASNALYPVWQHWLVHSTYIISD